MADTVSDCRSHSMACFVSFPPIAREFPPGTVRAYPWWKEAIP